jgi:trans-aconitate methyltransferase
VVAALTPGSHQLVDWTAPDRYPEIFAAAAAAAPDARRILSFGCSTGEECVSLAEYFPKAEIVGAEINALSLLKAWKKRSDRIRFVYSGDRILSRLGGFDVVFCMAVLRAPKKQQRLGNYPFEVFEERALFLESLVRPGGLLVIHNSMYRFSDTAHRGSYDRIPVTEVEPDGCLWRKRGP